MPPKNRNKFGLSIPVDPRWKALDGLGNTRSLPSTPNSNALETEESQVQRKKKKLTKQLSLSERTRDMAWEKRRKQVYRQEKRRNSMEIVSPGQGGQVEDLTDADLHELRGSIELGFGFNEQDQDGHTLCQTLPALDLYFAVNRHLSSSPLSSPGSRRSSSSSITSPQSDESWRICSPGDSPQQVKTKLRHWAQVVACSVMQSS